MSKTSDGPHNEPEFASAGNPPTFAADLTLVSQYAAEYGNLKIGTTAQRNAFTPWEGLHWYDTTLDYVLKHNGSAWGAGDTLPTYSGRLTSTVTLLNNNLTVIPDFTDVQKTGGFTEASGVVTLPLTGQYALDVSPYTVLGGATHFVAFLLNGATSAERIAGAEGGSALNLSITRKFTAGNTIRVQSYQNSGSTRTLSDMAGGATLPFLNIRYLGPV